MISQAELDVMSPKMGIKYFEEGFSIATLGNFEEVPENAIGANITTVFPVVGADGKFILSSCSYNLFIGNILSIDFVLEEVENNKISSISPEKIKYMKQEGITQLVSTDKGFAPFRYGDAVFATYDEFAQGITNIKQSFDSVDFSMKNREDQAPHM